MDDNKIKDALAAARKRAGLTQAEAADLAGTSQPVISAYEQGRRAPSYGTISRLATAYSTPVSQLLAEATPSVEDRLVAALQRIEQLEQRVATLESREG